MGKFEDCESGRLLLRNGWVLIRVGMLLLVTAFPCRGHDEYNNLAALRWGTTEAVFQIRATWEEIRQSVVRDPEVAATEESDSGYSNSSASLLCKFNSQLFRRFSLHLDDGEVPLVPRAVILPPTTRESGKLLDHDVVVFELEALKWQLPDERNFQVTIKHSPTETMLRIPVIYDVTIASAAGTVCKNGNLVSTSPGTIVCPISQRLVTECADAERDQAELVDD